MSCRSLAVCTCTAYRCLSTASLPSVLYQRCPSPLHFPPYLSLPLFSSNAIHHPYTTQAPSPSPCHPAQARAITPFSMRACVWRALCTLFDYLTSAVTDLVHGLGTALSLAFSLCQRTPQHPSNPATTNTSTTNHIPPSAPPATSPPSSSSSTAMTKALMAYAQPMKIALAITITALFIVVPQLKYNQTQNGLWATVCIAFIRQDNTSSSFLTGYQVVMMTNTH